MRKSFIIAFGGLVLALITLSAVLSFARAQGQQNPQAQGQRGESAPNANAVVGGRRGGQPPVPSQPAPRWPDGHPRLGQAPGETGIWGAVRGGGLANANTPFQPWAAALYEYRRTDEVEPHVRCKPSGGMRQFATPYGTEFVEFPDLQRIFIMDIGGPHSFRTVFMDGRPHPKDLVPTYLGHSIGRWEGDTLVVDTVGFNERFWMDRRTPHTDKLHFIERFTRTDHDNMKYEVTIDDPGAYTATWSTGPFSFGWNPGQELFEYICQDNNFAPVAKIVPATVPNTTIETTGVALFLGEEGDIDHSSPIIP